MDSTDAWTTPGLPETEESVAEAFRRDEQGPPPPARFHKRKSWTATYHEVWEYREVLYFLVLRNLKIRYRQTILGGAWSVLQPLALMGLFLVIFERLIAVGSEGVPYPLFALAALVPWGLFSQSLTLAAPSVVGDMNLVSKVYVPRLLIPLSAIGALVVDFLITLAILFVVMAIYSTSPDLSALAWIPSMTLLVLVTSVAVGVWLSALMVMYRDVRAIVPFLVQVLLFVTPVAYSTSLVPDRWLIVYGLNPMASVVEGFRSGLLGTDPPAARMLAASTIVAFALLGAGLSYFRRVDGIFADVI
jgi:lipopolysaccharide transport system permease protein